MKFPLTIILFGFCLLRCGVSGSYSCEQAPVAPKAPDPIAVSGAGGSLVSVFIEKLETHYNKKESGRAELSYNGVGDARGVKSLIAGDVSFAGIDVFGDALELSRSHPKEYLFVPVSTSAVVVAYNLPGRKTPILLDSKALSGIFLGTVDNWSDAHIKSLNASEQPPDLKIAVLHCASQTGTSWLFSRYLSDVSETWSKKVGVSKHPDWPIGGKQPNVTSLAAGMFDTPGAICIFDYPFAIANKVPVASIVNAKGESIVPSEKSITAAATKTQYVPTEPTNVLNAEADGAYPIAFVMHIALPANRIFNGRNVIESPECNLVRLALTDGQSEQPRDYAATPEPLRKQVLEYFNPRPTTDAPHTQPTGASR